VSLCSCLFLTNQSAFSAILMNLFYRIYSFLNFYRESGISYWAMGMRKLVVVLLLSFTVVGSIVICRVEMWSKIFILVKYTWFSLRLCDCLVMVSNTLYLTGEAIIF